jgi:heptaprenyl diphosphate synthase
MAEQLKENRLKENRPKENRPKKGVSGREIALVGVFLAVILMVGLLERMIPLDFIVPGARLGFSNIVILTSIYIFRFRLSFLLVILKCLLTAVISGGISSFLYSISGSLLSLVAMWLAIRFMEKHMSPMGISVIGAMFHSTGQVITACVVLETVGIMAYLPLLLVLSTISGVIVGFVVGAVLPYLRAVIKDPAMKGVSSGRDISEKIPPKDKKIPARRIYNGEIASDGKTNPEVSFKLNREAVMILCLLLVTVALSISAAFLGSSSKLGNLTTEIYENGVLMEVLPMDRSEEFTIETARGYNRIFITEGNVRIIDADCAALTCVHSGAINRDGEMIACLPHHLVVKVKSDWDSGIDVISY